MTASEATTARRPRAFGSLEVLTLLLVVLVVAQRWVVSVFDGHAALQTFATVFVAVCVQATPFLVLGVVLSALITAVVPTSFWARAVPSHPALAWHLWRATRSEGTRRRHHLDRAFHGPASVLDAPERLRRDPDDDPMPHGRGPWRQLAAALRWSALRRLGQVSAPTLVLHGTHDRLIPAANARLLSRLIPAARLRLLPRAGHFVITDAGDIAGSLMARFLAEVDARRPAVLGSALPVSARPRLLAAAAA